MKYLITGGCGFIGSNFIHHILKSDPKCEILNYDKLTYAGNLNNLIGIDERYQFVKGDICDYDLFRSTCEVFEPDAVIAFAAESHVDRSIASPQEFLKTNVLGSEVILRIVKELKLSKLLHVSTDEVYGSLQSPEEALEDLAFAPNSPYSVSKAAGDLLCHAYYVTYNTPVVVVRGSNCYGPRQHPEKFIPKSITNLLTEKPIQVYGKGTNVREWIYVNDFCSGIETALYKGKLGEAYNLGGGSQNRISNNILAKELLEIFNNIQPIEYIVDRLGHDMRYALNSTKLRSLGWKPKYTLSSGLKATVAWYQQNDFWWKPLI